MRVNVRHVRGVTVVQPDADRLDVASVVPFCKGLEGLSEPRGSRVVLDLCRVRTMDSTGLGWLVHTFREIVAGGGSLWLAGVRPQVGTLLRITELDRLIAVYADVADALAVWGDPVEANVGVGNHDSDGRLQGRMGS